MSPFDEMELCHSFFVTVGMRATPQSPSYLVEDDVHGGEALQSSYGIHVIDSSLSMFLQEADR